MWVGNKKPGVVMTDQSVILVVETLQARARALRACCVGARDLALAYCADLEEVLPTAVRSGAAVVLFALEFPGPDGLDQVRTLQADPRTSLIPIVIVTANPDREAMARAFKAGVSDYLIGVPDCRDLIARLRYQAGRNLTIRQQYEALASLHETQNELRSANAELLRTVTFDSVLGIATPWMLDDYLDIQRRRSAREQTGLSLVRLTLDGFSTWQAQAGEARACDCLQRVAGVLKDCAQRPADIAGRFDEADFVIILPATTEEGAQIVAVKLRHAMAQLIADCASSSEEIPLVASISVSCESVANSPKPC